MFLSNVLKKLCAIAPKTKWGSDRLSNIHLRLASKGSTATATNGRIIVSVSEGRSGGGVERVVEAALMSKVLPKGSVVLYDQDGDVGVRPEGGGAAVRLPHSDTPYPEFSGIYKQHADGTLDGVFVDPKELAQAIAVFAAIPDCNIVIRPNPSERSLYITGYKDDYAVTSVVMGLSVEPGEMEPKAEDDSVTEAEPVDESAGDPAVEDDLEDILAAKDDGEDDSDEDSDGTNNPTAEAADEDDSEVNDESEDEDEDAEFNRIMKKLAAF